jgi:hypothetical protein
MLGLKKEVDKTNPETKERNPANNKSKEGSFRKLSQDPASIEAKAGRVANDAPRMQRDAVR